MEKRFLAKAGSKIFLGILLVVLGVVLTSNSFAGLTLNLIKNKMNGDQVLTGHVPLVVKNGTAQLINHANMDLSAQIILPLSNQGQLDNLLQGLYDRQNPNFHHFLTPAQFALQFAPPASNVAQIRQYLKNYGISLTGQSQNGAFLNVTGPVSAFEQAFGLLINNYQNSDGTVFYASQTEPTIPATLAGMILAFGGLDNLPKYKTYLHQHKPNVAVSPMAASSPCQGQVFNIGSGECKALAPSDVETIYNFKSIPSTGSGQTVAVFELDGYKSSDIATFDGEYGIPSVILTNVLLNGFNGVPNFGANGGADEVTLDIELVNAFAPGSSILVYEASNTTSNWIYEWNQIASDDKAKVISCSWGGPEAEDIATRQTDNIVFSQLAAQGQAVFVASGDNGAYDAGGSVLGVDEPSAQPYVTAVGISKVTTNANGIYTGYTAETASSIGGGGISEVQTIPAYQLPLAQISKQTQPAAKVSTSMRNVPDVALTADESTPYSFYIDGAWGAFYGSSVSAPIWASLIARVNQGLGANAPIGSVNTALYSLAQTSSSYSNDFHDITTGNNGYYPAEPGYDDATGLGSFNGYNLYNDLAKAAIAVNPPSAPTGLTATAGNAEVSLSWTATSGAASYNVLKSTANGGPYTTIATLVLNTTYVDSAVVNGTTYYYVVAAVNSAGPGADSNQVSATPELPALPLPAVPAGLSASAGNAQVSLSWDTSANASSYNVKRTTTVNGNYTTIVNITKTNYVDKTVSNGTTYYYVVSALNASGESANSAQVSATSVATSGVMPVTNLTGSATTFMWQAAILLQWNPSPSPNVTQYKIYRSTGTNSPAFYGSIGAYYTGVYDPGVSYGTTYNYYVTAVNASGVESPASNQIAVLMSSRPTQRKWPPTWPRRWR